MIYASVEKRHSSLEKYLLFGSHRLTEYPRHMDVIVRRYYIGHSLLTFVTTLNSRTSNFKIEHTHFYSMTILTLKTQMHSIEQSKN